MNLPFGAGFHYIRLTIQAVIAYNTELSSRGVSGTLNQQSAIVGVMFRRGLERWSCPP